MSDILDPNYLNYPEQVHKNKKDIEKLNKVYKTTQNLTSSTTTINVNTTNIVDLDNCIIDRFLFSRNGLLFKIKSYTNETLYIEFYSDLSSTNEVITNFEFNPDVVVYENGNARIVGTIKYNQDSLLEPVEAPAEINIPIIAGEGMVVDANEENDKIEIHIDNDVISNPNLLINGDFRVNQRGKTTYTGTGYSVDRWKSTNANTIVDKTDEGITLSAVSAGNGYINQFIENGYELLKGKTLTFSICINGEVYKATGDVFTEIPSSTKPIAVISNISNTTAVGLYLQSSGNMIVQVGVIAGNTLKVNWVKLELGLVATTFIPKLYAEELVSCQRYYQIRSNTYTIQAKAIDRPIPMRVDGTIGTTTIDGVAYNTVDAEIY